MKIFLLFPKTDLRIFLFKFRGDLRSFFVYRIPRWIEIKHRTFIPLRFLKFRRQQKIFPLICYPRDKLFWRLHILPPTRNDSQMRRILLSSHDNFPVSHIPEPSQEYRSKNTSCTTKKRPKEVFALIGFPFSFLV